MQQLGTAGDVLCPFAIEACLQIDRAAVQGCRHSQYLEGGSRLVAIGNTPVSPLLQTGLLQRLLVGRFRCIVGVRPLLHSQVILLHLLQQLGRRGVGNFQIGIGVIAAKGGHRQNLPGVYVHHHAKCAVLHIVTGDGRLHLLFQTGLDGGIDGHHHIVSRLAGKIAFIGKGHIHFIVALGCDHLGGFAF